MASPSIWKYKWFDTPSNQDGVKKVVAFGKLGAKVGIILGVGDALFMENANKLQRAARVCGWFFPAIGMTTAFTITTQLSLQIFPTMDEKFAYMFGGWAAGGILGNAFKSSQLAFTSAVWLGGAAFAYRYLRQGRESTKGTRWSEQFSFLPDEKETPFIIYERRQPSHWLTNTYDYTLFKQPNRGGEIDPRFN